MRRQRRDPDDGAGTPGDAESALILVRPRPRDAHLGAMLAIVASLLLVAVAKPWGSPSPAPTLAAVATPFVATAVAPSPTEDVSPQGLAAPICLGAGGWQVASLETWQRHDVRVWRAIAPAASASGPLDPAIPSVPVVAVGVAALGWCAPSFGPREPVGPVAVDAWRVEDGRVTPVALQQVQPELGTTPLAALYVIVTPAAPYPPSDRGHRGWPTGRVVFRWEDEATGTAAWFAADVTLLPPTTESPEGSGGPAGPAG